MKQATRKNIQAVTLIELMTVVAVIAILIAVAMPNYQQFKREGRRADAQAGLMQVHSILTNYMATNDTMTWAAATYPAASAKSFYTLSVADDGTGSYVITATAKGAQASDTPCLTIKLYQNGTKSPTACW